MRFNHCLGMFHHFATATVATRTGNLIVTLSFLDFPKVEMAVENIIKHFSWKWWIELCFLEILSILGAFRVPFLKEEFDLLNCRELPRLTSEAREKEFWPVRTWKGRFRGKHIYLSTSRIFEPKFSENTQQPNKPLRMSSWYHENGSAATNNSSCFSTTLSMSFRCGPVRWDSVSFSKSPDFLKCVFLYFFSKKVIIFPKDLVEADILFQDWHVLGSSMRNWPGSLRVKRFPSEISPANLLGQTQLRLIVSTLLLFLYECSEHLHSLLQDWNILFYIRLHSFLGIIIMAILKSRINLGIAGEQAQPSLIISLDFISSFQFARLLYNRPV